MRAWSPRADGDTTAPMGPPGHGLHAARAAARGQWQIDPGVVVPHPPPIAARADGPQDRVAEETLAASGAPNRCSKASESWLMRTSLYSQYVPGACSGLRVALAAGGRARFVRHMAVAVHRVGHAKADAFPFARLLQQVRPGDLGRLCADLESDAAARVRSQVRSQVGQQTATMSHTGEQREVGLGHAEGQVGAVGLAPGGNLDGRAAARRPTQGPPLVCTGPRRRLKGAGIGMVYAPALTGWRTGRAARAPHAR